ncbi:nicotinamide-nucleotide adenylyltransferase LALA0_S11e00694g [Lachancea lanzarotensis]|uniref:LALA0S11e00694g1_1 n=1 Tax=Lachancea lanzarotensis TaxID=1245769 RepID=A0A0C7N293_9SACH|nr:uncharacterized protein LALA0_S11e00694g [Lachancea lanzarotensis]CEP64286.1 LALA0S11e00694g1_1 [Lachancea lanzarotensis]
MLIKKCSEHLKTFLASNATFEIIYGQRQINNIDRLLVLDSSFNPPHNGHLNLIRKAAQRYRDSRLHIVLLLSLNNADKEVKPAAFDKRLDMMCLFCDSLEKDAMKTSVAVTTYGKFVEKSKVIHNKLGDGFQVVYLVGFDTITRIFDPKYYAPSLVAEALASFMDKTELYCLTRGGNSEIEQQLNYPEDIAKGEYEPEIPRIWHQKIVVEQNTPNANEISSTIVRSMISSGERGAIALMPKVIYEYALQKQDGLTIFEVKK